MKHNKNRTKVIPDKMFNTLWNKAQIINNKEEYYRVFTSISSDDYVDFYKEFNLKVEETIEMLSNIYDCSKMSLKDICIEKNIKKSKISQIFCIPTRTIEDWYYEKNKIPPYIKLLLVRYFHLLYLGKYIKVESEILYDKTKPKTYEHRKREVLKDTNTSNEHNEDDYLKYKDENTEIKRSLEIRELLNKTDYLDNIMNRKR